MNFIKFPLHRCKEQIPMKCDKFILYNESGTKYTIIDVIMQLNVVKCKDLVLDLDQLNWNEFEEYDILQDRHYYQNVIIRSKRDSVQKYYTGTWNNNELVTNRNQIYQARNRGIKVNTDWITDGYQIYRRKKRGRY